MHVVHNTFDVERNMKKNLVNQSLNVTYETGLLICNLIS